MYFIYVLIDKRKPTAGVGWVEFVRMNKKEFRANLYRTYVSSGMHDHILIQKNIEIAESFVFDKHGITAFDLNKINIAMAEGTRQSNGSYALGKT